MSLLHDTLQVHIRVASPPIRFPCYMGINIPTKEELIANKPEFEDIASYIGKSGCKDLLRFCKQVHTLSNLKFLFFNYYYVL